MGGKTGGEWSDRDQTHRVCSPGGSKPGGLESGLKIELSLRVRAIFTLLVLNFC